MEYNTELLLTQSALKQLLTDHKSNLQELADELSVAVGTLKNYLYAQTLLENMPYHLHRKLTTYTQGGDILKPKKRVLLTQNEFYSLAELTGRDIIDRRGLAIDEFNKALLKFIERSTIKDASKLEPIYFFLDLEYQEDFVNCAGLPKNIDDELLKALGVKVRLTLDQVRRIVKNKNDWSDVMRTCEPKIVSKLVKLNIETTDNPVFSELLFNKNLNIYFYLTNVKYKDGHISREIISDLRQNAFMLHDQDAYFFDDDVCTWVNCDDDTTLSTHEVQHLAPISYNDCDWSAFGVYDETNGPSDLRYAKEIIVRNLFTKCFFDVGDDGSIWGRPLNVVVQEMFSVQGADFISEGELDPEELESFVANADVIKVLGYNRSSQMMTSLLTLMIFVKHTVLSELGLIKNFPIIPKGIKLIEI